MFSPAETRYVIVADSTLARNYRSVPLLDFLASAPTSALPGFIYSFLRGPPPPDNHGRSAVAPYSVRKLEAALLKEHGREEVVVAHEDHLAEFIDDDTEVVGVTTMDPFLLGHHHITNAV